MVLGYLAVVACLGGATGAEPEFCRHQGMPKVSRPTKPD